MARPYTINVTNGVGTANVTSGNYTVTSNTLGYSNTTIDPSTLVVDKETYTYNFTIAATGTLTIHITEDGTAGGTAVVGATIIRCDVNESEYGDVITTDSNGNAVFNNVPFAEADGPVIYYKQKTSDGDHEFDSTLQNVSLTESTMTVEVRNDPPLLRTINFTDENYSGLPIGTGTITLS